MVLFMILRRLSPRVRQVVGVMLVVAGLGLLVASATVHGLLIHGAIVTVVGGVFWGSGAAAARRHGR